MKRDGDKKTPTGRRNYCIMGYARAGKDTFAEFLAQATKGKRGSVSDILIPMYCKENNCSIAGVVADKNSDDAERVAWIRSQLYQFGRGVEAVDPAYFIRALLVDGCNIITGVRTKGELSIAREDELFDKYIWITRVGLKPTTDLNIGPADADIELQFGEGDFAAMALMAAAIALMAKELAGK